MVSGDSFSRIGAQLTAMLDGRQEKLDPDEIDRLSNSAPSLMYWRQVAKEMASEATRSTAKTKKKDAASAEALWGVAKNIKAWTVTTARVF